MEKSLLLARLSRIVDYVPPAAAAPRATLEARHAVYREAIAELDRGASFIAIAQKAANKIQELGNAATAEGRAALASWKLIKSNIDDIAGRA